MTNLHNRERAGSGDLPLPSQPISRQTVLGPDGRVPTVKAQGIGVEAIDVDAGRCGRGDRTELPSLVADPGYSDASVPKLVFDMVPVVKVRHRVRLNR